MDAVQVMRATRTDFRVCPTSYWAPHDMLAGRPHSAYTAFVRRRGGVKFEWFPVAIFLGATLCTGIEPVLIGMSQSNPGGGSAEGAGYAYSLSSAIACAEAFKTAICAVCMYITAEKDHAPSLADLRYSRIQPFLLPAILLAISNQTLFLAIEYLGALLTQIARRAVCILATAVLAQLVMGQRLNGNQQISLVMLTCGFTLLLPHVDLSHMGSSDSLSPDSAAGLLGLIAAFVGGSCAGGQGVFFEKASKGKLDQSVYMQTFLFSLFGFMANASMLVLTQVCVCK